MPRRCAIGCTPTKGILHVFPNPNKFPQQYKAWVQVVRGQDKGDFDHKKMRICDRHFTERDRNRNNRLNALAVPSLFLNENISVPSTSEPCFSTSSMSVQTLRKPLSENRQLSSDNLMQRACISTNIRCELAFDKTSNFVGTLSDISPKVFYNSLLEHNYSRLTMTTPNKRSSKKNMFSAAVISNRHIVYKKNIKNLRQQIYRLRKSRKDIKIKLERAENLFHNSDFQKVVKDMTPAAKCFTSMQYYQTRKKPTGRRFKLEEKVLSLSLYKRSPKSYGFMSKFFVLPSPKCLKRLLAQITLNPGVNNVIFEQLKRSVSKLDTKDRLCTLIFDEMSITPQIHYDSIKDEFVGFTSNEKKCIANHALVFMIKGIKRNYKQPIAYYFTNSLSKLELKRIIKDVIRMIQETGFIILCTVCDQSTVNVGAIDSLIEETRVKYLREGKEISHRYFEVNKKKYIPLYDVPHLLKGLRNNLLTKTMSYIDYNDQNKEKIVKWEYLQQLYAADKCFGELRCLQKLTEEHVNPEKIKKMRVKTAAQIFSHSVAVATNHLMARGILPKDCQALIPITLLIDHLFDSLNCSSFKVPDGKIYKGPVKRNSPHHQLWQKAKKYLRSIKFEYIKKTNNKIQKIETVVPSTNNFIKTIEGIQELWKILSYKYSFDSMSTRNFNQDPLENFFGNIRNCGARNTGPNVMAFEGAFKSLLLNNLNSTHSVHANCEEDDNSFLHNLNFFLKQNKTTPSTNISKEKAITLRDDILNDIRIPNDLGQRSYVCGWVLRKCLKNVIKNCKACKKTVLSVKNSENNSFIAAKEYFNDKKWLVYPSEQLYECFHNIQSICVSHLTKDVPKRGLKKEISNLTEIFVEYPFNCEKHREKLIKYFTDVTVNVIVYSWCRSINRILAGKLTYNGDDEIKIYAQQYYNKHRHNKLHK